MLTKIQVITVVLKFMTMANWLKILLAIQSLQKGFGMTDIEKEIRKSGYYDAMLNGVAVIDNTFHSDFSIAELFGGKNAIKDTFDRAFKSFKKDIRYLTALVICLNHRGHVFYEGGDKDLAKLYFDLQHKLDAFILESKGFGEKWKPINFTENEIKYYLQATDQGKE